MATRCRISSAPEVAAGGAGWDVLEAWRREDFDRIPDGDPAVVEHIGAQAAPAGPVADDGCCVVRRVFQSPAEAATRLAQFDTVESTIADPEVSTDQCVEANATGDQVAPAEREIGRLSEQLAEDLDFLGFDQRQVLPGPVRAAAMAVAFDALMGECLDLAFGDHWGAGLWADEQTFDDHEYALVFNEGARQKSMFESITWFLGCTVSPKQVTYDLLPIKYDRVVKNSKAISLSRLGRGNKSSIHLSTCISARSR